MKRELKADLKRLEGMSFGRLKHCGPLVERFHALAGRINGDAQAEGIWKVYDWLLAPFALWPLEFEELSADLLKVVESGKLDADFRFFLELMDGPPPAREQRAIAKYEKDVEAGRYDPILKQRAKFREGERRLREDPDLRVFWERIKRRFEVEKFQNARGVLRRRVTGERNFREGWKFDWGSERGRLQEMMDAFCHRWNLYGMEKERSLLMKVTVNPTAHGTMIFIPRGLSFDPKRDLNWKLIGLLHRCRVKAKQGPKLSAGRMEKIEEAKRARRLWAEARKKGMKGEARYEYVRQRMGRDARADQKWLWRMLRKDF